MPDLDPIVGHSLGQPSFVDPQPHERPERKPRDPVAALRGEGTPHVQAGAVHPSGAVVHDLHATLRPSDGELSERFQGLAPTPTPGRENVGLLERDTPESPAPWSALQQSDPTSDLERQIRELTAKNERLNEQIAVLRQGPRPEVDHTVTKVRR